MNEKLEDLVLREPTPSNGFRLDEFRLIKDVGKNWFTSRVADEWKSLGNHELSGNTIVIFNSKPFSKPLAPIL